MNSTQQTEARPTTEQIEAEIDEAIAETVAWMERHAARDRVPLAV